MKTYILASKNAHKAKEIKEILSTGNPEAQND